MSAVHIVHVALLAVSCILVNVEGWITQRPDDEVAALVGERVVLRCSTNRSTVNWKWAGVCDNIYENATTIFDGRRVVANMPRFTVNTSSPGQFDLVIQSAAAADAGWYRCHDEESPYGGRARLIVFSSPTCTVKSTNYSDGLVAEGDLLSVNCTASFYNVESCHWEHLVHAVLKWPEVNGFIPLLYENDDSTRVKKTIGFAVFSTVATMELSKVGLPHACSVIFPSIDCEFESLRCKNVGLRKCNVPNLNVLFPPRNVNIIPHYNGSIYDVGSVLTCQADGNPTVGYEWTDSEGCMLSSTSELTRSVEGKHDYRCTASNVIRGVTHRETIYFSVDVIDFRKRESLNITEGSCLNSLETSAQQGCHLSLLLGLCSSVACLQCVPLIFVVICCRRQNSRYREMEVARQGRVSDSSYEHLRF